MDVPYGEGLPLWGARFGVEFVGLGLKGLLFGYKRGLYILPETCLERNRDLLSFGLGCVRFCVQLRKARSDNIL